MYACLRVCPWCVSVFVYAYVHFCTSRKEHRNTDISNTHIISSFFLNGENSSFLQRYCIHTCSSFLSRNICMTHTYE